MNVTVEDVMHHIANSCEGYQDGELYFFSPSVVGDTLKITVANETEGTEQDFAFKAVDFK